MWPSVTIRIRAHHYNIYWGELNISSCIGMSNLQRLGVVTIGRVADTYADVFWGKSDPVKHAETGSVARPANHVCVNYFQSV